MCQIFYILIIVNKKTKGNGDQGIYPIDRYLLSFPSYTHFSSQSPILIYFCKIVSTIFLNYFWLENFFIHFHFGLLASKIVKDFGLFWYILEYWTISDFSLPSPSPSLSSPLCNKTPKMVGPTYQSLTRYRGTSFPTPRT